MAIFDFLKKKKKKQIEEKIEKTEKKGEKKEIEVVEKEVRPPKINRQYPGGRTSQKISLAPIVLEEPQITEKATDLEKLNQYVFKVSQKATKNQIKAGVEELYGVDVQGVRIIKIPAKKRQLRGKIGWKTGYKKAIVKIKQGQKIEVLPR